MMENFRKSFFSVIAMLTVALGVSAQSFEASGTVTLKSDGFEAIGAHVIEQGTSNAAVTDMNGHFSLKVAKGANLQISYVGCETVTVKADKDMKIELDDEGKAMQEVVVTGYQVQRKADLTGAVSVVTVDDIKKTGENNPIKALQGRVPGMNITTDGSPSGAATVRIRGIGSFNDNDPLYIVDGVPTKSGMHELNPNDIESIQVLKDAASASIYGSRAANGVIIITTKKGKDGAVHVDFDASVSIQMYTSKMNVLNADQYGKVLWQALVNDGDDPNTNKLGYKYDWRYNNGVPTLYGQTINEFLDPNNRTMPSSDTDWFKEITRTGLIHQYNASLSRGGETGSSFFSLGYYGNKGIVKNTDFSRISGRMNNEFKFLKDIITVGEHFTFSRTNETVMPGDVLNNALNMNPLVPVYSANGGWGGQVGSLPDLFNPVRTLEYNKNNGYGLWRTFGDAYLNVNPLKGLNIKTTFGIDYLSKDEKSYKLPYVEGIKHSDDNGVTMRREQTMRWMWNAVASYNLEAGKNRFDVLAGIELNHSNYEWHSSYKEDFAHYTTDYMYPSAGSGESKAEGGSDGFALVSLFGKANYTFDNKYLASVTVRYDGSSRFGKNNRYATFPSFSLGWRLSEEKFMEGTRSWLDDLKPRFSWGQTGNSEISNIARYTIYKFATGDGGIWSGGGYGTGYDIAGTNGGAGTLPSGFKREQIGNEDIKWETTTQSNIGLDFGLFNNRLYGSFEYYWKNTKDILIFMAGSAAQGEGNLQWRNAGEMKNNGLELTLGWRNKTHYGLNYNITGNIGQYSNKITSAPITNATNNSLGGDGLNIIGHPMGARGGYICDGIFKSQEEVDNHAKQEGAGVGRLRYRDLDGNGVIDDADKDWICSPVPAFTYGLNIYLEYKGFDFTAFFQGVAGLDIVNDVKRRTDFFGIENMPYLNKGDRLLNAWTPANPDSDIPAVSLNNPNREDRLSTYYVENGSYLKLRNLQIGYSFHGDVLKKLSMTRLRLYLSAQNVFTIKGKSFTGVDPEIPNMNYPIPMNLSFGVNVGF